MNVRRRARSGTSGSGRCVASSTTRPGSSIPDAQTNVATLLAISGSLSIPALGSLIIRGRVPQPRLAERVALRRARSVDDVATIHTCKAVRNFNFGEENVVRHAEYLPFMTAVVRRLVSKDGV